MQSDSTARSEAEKRLAEAVGFRVDETGIAHHPSGAFAVDYIVWMESCMSRLWNHALSLQAEVERLTRERDAYKDASGDLTPEELDKVLDAKIGQMLPDNLMTAVDAAMWKERAEAAESKLSGEKWVRVDSREDLPSCETHVWMFLRGVGPVPGICTKLFELPWLYKGERLPLEDVAYYINLNAIPFPIPPSESEEEKLNG